MYAESDLIALSALQHYQFCPRQCALIHLEGVWVESGLTAAGRLMHERADSKTRERRGDVLIVRSLLLKSLELGLSGKADVVEFLGKGNTRCIIPVEYKRGRAKKGLEDKVQLCAQAMCLEEMLDTGINSGALFYGAQKRRLEIAFTSELRDAVRNTAYNVHALIDSNETPPARLAPHCRSCSLLELCMPEQSGSQASRYVQTILDES